MARVCSCAVLLVCLLTVRAAEPGRAKQIFNAAGVEGGLVVHVGCGGGDLTAALRLNERLVVHGLDRDPSNVAKARRYIRSAGVYGPVAADAYDGEHLPYVDNLVNAVIVSEDPCRVTKEELLRVLVPGGVVVTNPKGNGPGLKWRKPVPAAIDSWPHYLHGPDNNAVAQDSVVGPPRRAQWIAGPAFARSHEINSSMAAMVTDGGRLFTIWDEGPTGMTDKRFPPKWSLIARDAFNGLVLWKRPMPQWGWRQWHSLARWNDPLERARMLRELPATTPRRLVAAADEVYVTLGYEAPVSVLDSRTGKVLQELDHTALTDELLLDEDTLVLRVRVPDSPPDKKVLVGSSPRTRAVVMAISAQTRKALWRSEPGEVAPLTLASRNGRVFYSNYERIVCLDRAGGKELWRSPTIAGRPGNRGTVGTLVAQDEVVLFTPYPMKSNKDSGRLLAFSAKTGELLWKGPKYMGPGITNPPDLFVANGLVWVGETRLPISHAHTELRRQGFDPLTGKVEREVVVPKLISWGHHYRCYRSKATERFLMLPKRGVEFVDLQGRDHMRHDWLRAPCIYGVLPANGLLYLAPHQCVCYPGVLLANFNALAPRADTAPVMPPPATRLRKGPAWSQIRNPKSEIQNDCDWPTLRADARRSGVAQTTLPSKLAAKWRVSPGGALTPPVVAGGMLLVADKDTHTLHALNADNGMPAWSYTAGARVDSPPTLHDGLVLFGSADGRVYCLRQSDGREVWRYLAAPVDRRLTVYGQVESAWPVHGSVLVHEDNTAKPPRPVAYFTAGRSSFLDGGIRVYGLDPRTGQKLYETRLDGPRADPFKEQGTAGYKDGSKSDVLTSDGSDIFLFQERFRGNLERVPAPMQNMGKEGGGFRVFPAAEGRGSSGRRLISTHGLLDGTYNEGKYWTYGNRWPGWDRKMSRAGTYGQLLVFNDRSLYGVHVFTESIRVRRGRNLGGKGERLFARDHGAKKDRWSVHVPIQVRGMVLAGDKLVIAGPPDTFPDTDPLASVEGRLGAKVRVLSAAAGKQLAEHKLEALPIYDGMIAANECLYIVTKDGAIQCLGSPGIRAAQ